jgi:hypothetical protein
VASIRSRTAALGGGLNRSAARLGFVATGFTALAAGLDLGAARCIFRAAMPGLATAAQFLGCNAARFVLTATGQLRAAAVLRFGFVGRDRTNKNQSEGKNQCIREICQHTGSPE